MCLGPAAAAYGMPCHAMPCPASCSTLIFGFLGVFCFSFSLSCLQIPGSLVCGWEAALAPGTSATSATRPRTGPQAPACPLVMVP